MDGPPELWHAHEQELADIVSIVLDGYVAPVDLTDLTVDVADRWRHGTTDQHLAIEILRVATARFEVIRTPHRDGGTRIAIGRPSK